MMVLTCSVQPWRCSAPELRKGCVFLKCHVGGFSISRCICDQWWWWWWSSSSQSSSSSPLFSLSSSSSPSSSPSSSSLWKSVDVTIRFNVFATGGWRICWSLLVICWCYDQIQHICNRGWWICWSLLKTSWCYSLFNIVVRRGGGCWSFMKTSGCDHLISHICFRGWWIFDSFWR